jgi:protein subunit release factor A
MLDGNIEVVVLKEEKAIMDDMGPETLKNVLADATVSTMKLMKISNFFNGRERHFVKERAEAAKKLKKKDDELKKAHADLRELDVSFEAYRDKYELHLTLTKTLEEKEQEEDQLAKDKKELVARVTELEGQLQKLTIPDEEEKKEDPSEEFTNTSRGALIKRVIELP